MFQGLEDKGSNIFTTDEERKALQQIVERAEARKRRFQELKKERAEIIGFFANIGGDPKVKQEALRRQLATNTEAWKKEFDVKDKTSCV